MDVTYNTKIKLFCEKCFEGRDKSCVVTPSLLRPIRLRAASSFSGRTYNTTQDNMHID
jgi:hypothetical protein